MVAAKASDEEIIEAWRRLGSPTLVAAEVGLSKTNLLHRRRRIEATHGISLESTAERPSFRKMAGDDARRAARRLEATCGK